MTNPNPIIAAYEEHKAHWDWDEDADGLDGPESRWLDYIRDADIGFDYTPEEEWLAKRHIEGVQEKEAMLSLLGTLKDAVEIEGAEDAEIIAGYTLMVRWHGVDLAVVVELA